jgi:hypothetical protein
MNEEGYIVLDPSVVFGSNSLSLSSSESEFEDMFTQTKLSVVSISVGAGLISIQWEKGQASLIPLGVTRCRICSISVDSTLRWT